MIVVVLVAHVLVDNAEADLPHWGVDASVEFSWWEEPIARSAWSEVYLEASDEMGLLARTQAIYGGQVQGLSSNSYSGGPAIRTYAASTSWYTIGSDTLPPRTEITLWLVVDTSGVLQNTTTYLQGADVSSPRARGRAAVWFFDRDVPVVEHHGWDVMERTGPMGQGPPEASGWEDWQVDVEPSGVVDVLDSLPFQARIGDHFSVSVELWTNTPALDWEQAGLLEADFFGTSAALPRPDDPANVSVSLIPIPEPGTLAQLGACIAGLLAYACRKHRRARESIQ